MMPYIMRRLALTFLWLAVTGLGGYLAYLWWGEITALVTLLIWCAVTGMNISDTKTRR